MQKIIYPNDRNRSLLPIYVVTVGTGHKQEPIVRPNGAGVHHFLFIEDGEGVFESEMGKFSLQKNTVIFIRKGYPIKYSTVHESFTTGWLTFDGECLDDLLEYFSVKSFSFCDSSPLYSKFISCIKLCDHNASSAQLSKAMYDLVISYFSNLNIAPSPAPIVKAKEYMCEKFDKDIAIADISAASGISQSLLFRLFKKSEGCTPIEYLRQLRIEKAKQSLISYPLLHVDDIARGCGFSGTSYFCKVFRESTGMSPITFRNTYKI